MKRFYAFLFLLLCFSTKIFSHTVVLEIDSVSQNRQDFALRNCDTLIVFCLTNSPLYFARDTIANGHINFAQQVSADYHHYATPNHDTSIFYHLSSYTNLYIGNLAGIIYDALSFAECGCHAGIQIAHQSFAYTFSPVHAILGNDSVSYIWTLNGGTLLTDSLTGQSNYTFDTSGAYQICLHLQNDIAACSFDTCKTFSITVNNGSYYPLLDTINIWHLSDNICFEEPFHSQVPRSNDCNYPFYYPGSYYTDIDTIIDSVSYKRVIVDGYLYWSGQCVFGYIREDLTARRVYFKDVLNNPEILLYDFSMQIGDTIRINFPYQNSFYNNGTYRLDSIRTTNHNTQSKPVFYLKQPGNSYQGPLIWTEGIGNLGDPFYPYTNYQFSCCPFYNCMPNGNQTFPYSYSTFVTCFEHQQKVYFDTCTFNEASPWGYWCFEFLDSCTYGVVCGGIQEISSLSSFATSPNPASDYAVLDIDVKQSNNFSIVVQSLEGKKVLSETNLGWLQAGKHNKTISTTNLSSGIYLVGCHTNEGTVYRKLVVANSR